jgi:hypothetical protein
VIGDRVDADEQVTIAGIIPVGNLHMQIDGRGVQAERG